MQHPKLFYKNIDIINSEMYREGPTDFKKGKGMDTQVVFYKFTKEGEEWIPLPKKLIMHAIKDIKVILDSKADNTFINIEEKDMENIKCEKCSIEEDCGIYLTRQQAKLQRAQGINTQHTELLNNKVKAKALKWTTCEGTGFVCKRKKAETKEEHEYHNHKDKKDYLKIKGVIPNGIQI